jgi:arginine/serine-rich splicing factor 12
MTNRKISKTPTKRKTYFEKYDLYSDANPKDTIRIKYDTVENTKKTIKKLEELRKSGKYTHSRIVQVTNVMTQRLRVIYNNTGKGKTRYNLSKKYFEKLKKDTKRKSKSRRRKSPKPKSKSRRRKTPKRKSKSRRRKTPKRKSKSRRRKTPKRKSKSRRRKSPKPKSKSRRRKYK